MIKFFHDFRQNAPIQSFAVNLILDLSSLLGNFAHIEVCLIGSRKVASAETLRGDR